MITLKNINGMEVQISNYGATILSAMVPDRDNKPVNVVVGLAQAEDYYGKKVLVLEKRFTMPLQILLKNQWSKKL